MDQIKPNLMRTPKIVVEIDYFNLFYTKIMKLCIVVTLNISAVPHLIRVFFTETSIYVLITLSD